MVKYPFGSIPSAEVWSVAVASAAALLLVLLSIVVLMGIAQDTQRLLEQIVLVAFVEPRLNTKELERVQYDIQTIQGIDSVLLQSTAEVREGFTKRYTAGIDAVLPENAFPAVLTLRLKKAYRAKERIDSLVSMVLGVQHVQNVSYHAPFLEAVEQRQRQEHVARWIAGSVCCLVVLVLLWQAISCTNLTLHMRAAGIVLGVVLGICVSGTVFFVCSKYYAWLHQGGALLFMKLSGIGSAAVCACATILIALRLITRSVPRGTLERV
ncbi:MAG: permease-like cell division protein FtsX [Bacteroidota bacterium]|nr:permease-like cell division protein FtsX [Candidatus Kapabacteria bacterium]MDW8219185.1 permease-like cell division protein FtsX [Bacteroidota bacterium]